MHDFLARLNGDRHETALRVFVAIVLAHWGEHLLQAFQIYVLGWPVPEARGLVGYFFPVLVSSEILHYGLPAGESFTPDVRGRGDCAGSGSV
jgi:hypothetical protein